MCFWIWHLNHTRRETKCARLILNNNPETRQRTLELHTRSHKNALAINVRCTIRLKVLMRLLRVVMLVCHLKHLSGCDSPELPVQLRRFLSIGRISSVSYHRLGFVIIFNRAQPRQRIEKQWATDSRPWHATIKCFAIEPVTLVAHGRLTHPPGFWQL